LRLRNPFRTTAPSSQPRRRKRRRADAPRTIVPLAEQPVAPVEPAPFAVELDAARERLRRAIPPLADDGER
jgi:hypothetical protein